MQHWAMPLSPMSFKRTRSIRLGFPLPRQCCTQMEASTVHGASHRQPESMPIVQCTPLQDAGRCVLYFALNGEWRNYSSSLSLSNNLFFFCAPILNDAAILGYCERLLFPCCKETHHFQNTWAPAQVEIKAPHCVNLSVSPPIRSPS